MGEIGNGFYEAYVPEEFIKAVSEALERFDEYDGISNEGKSGIKGNNDGYVREGVPSYSFDFSSILKTFGTPKPITKAVHVAQTEIINTLKEINNGADAINKIESLFVYLFLSDDKNLEEPLLKKDSLEPKDAYVDDGHDWDEIPWQKSEKGHRFQVSGDSSRIVRRLENKTDTTTLKSKESLNFALKNYLPPK